MEAHEVELEAGGDHRHAHHGAADDDQRIGLTGVLEGFLEAVRVLLAVLELQRIDRQHLLADLIPALAVEEGVQPGAGADAVVVRALGADVDVLLQVGLVEHRPSGTVRRSAGSPC